MNSRPFSVKVTECSRFMSRTSPVTPYGLIVVAVTSCHVSKCWAAKSRRRSLYLQSDFLVFLLFRQEECEFIAPTGQKPVNSWQCSVPGVRKDGS